MKYRGIFEYEYPAEHKPPVSIDVHLHGDCVKGKIIEWEYRPLEQEPTTKNDLGVDLISRAEVLKLMKDNWHTHNGDWAMQESMDDIRALPSVTPQEPILDKIFCIVHPLSIMSTPELEHKAIMQIAEMLEPLCLPESEDNK